MVNIKYYYNYTSQKCNFDLEESHFLRYKKRDNLFQKLLPNWSNYICPLRWIKICFLFCKVVVKFDVILNNMTCHFDIGDDAMHLLAWLKIECIRNRKILIIMKSETIIACSCINYLDRVLYCHCNHKYEDNRKGYHF